MVRCSTAHVPCAHIHVAIPCSPYYVIRPRIGVVGITNWVLDVAADASGCLVLAKCFTWG